MSIQPLIPIKVYKLTTPPLTCCIIIDHSIQLQTFNTLQQDLQSHINSNSNQILPYLNCINVLLHQAVATCKAAALVSKPPETLNKKEIMPPGKSRERQWRFVKTTKPPGRKKNGNVLRYIFICMYCSSNVIIKAC